MTWSVNVSADSSDAGEPNAITLRFVAKPEQYFVITGAPQLVSRLKRNGHATVPVLFEVYCT